MGKIFIEERAINLAQYIIDSGDTVRGAAKKFGISKSTVHTDVTLKNGKKKTSSSQSIEIKGVFLSEKNLVKTSEKIDKNISDFEITNLTTYNSRELKCKRIEECIINSKLLIV